jgi:tryptophan-rich sensory protein
MKNLYKFVVSVIGCELVGILGSIFTIPAIPTWYTHLIKPTFAPPSWIFGPIWITLYFLMGISFYLIWKQGWSKKKVKTAGLFFLGQLTLNFMWSPIFFGLRAPLLGFLVIVAMLVLIMITIKKFYPLSKWAAYLLIPYVLWVSFATILNAAIAILN